MAWDLSGAPWIIGFSTPAFGLFDEEDQRFQLVALTISADAFRVERCAGDIAGLSLSTALLQTLFNVRWRMMNPTKEEG